MTTGETLDKLLADVVFAAPVTPEDCDAVKGALKEVFEGSKVEVYCHKSEEVVIRVYINGAPTTERRVAVIP